MAMEVGLITRELRRCTKCILPETFPGIVFDEEGVCNICHEHVPVVVRGEEKLAQLLDQRHPPTSDFDCIVTLSGGRDSTYVLHRAVKRYEQRVLAMTYDNGQLHPVAYENMRRATAMLDVPHTIVPGNKTAIRNDLRRNLQAWLHRPSLAMIPTFMISGKVAEYHVARLARRKKIPTVLDGTTEIERTDFKTAYLGARETALGEVQAHSLLRVLSQYAREYARNPRYINPSLLRAARSFFVFFFYRRFFMGDLLVRLFDFEPWDEQSILATIRDELGWESPPDTDATWRTDDNISCLYNWFYASLVGFTENDALYSNMIREGMIDRQEAMKRVSKENRPRYETIRRLLSDLKISMSIDEIERVLTTARDRLTAAGSGSY